MEKRKPHHNLASFRDAAARINVTRVALRDARAIGFNRALMVETIKSMRPTQFYKSMTAYADSRCWQDVYHVPWEGHLLYVKFTDDRLTAFRLLSFKEK